MKDLDYDTLCGIVIFVALILVSAVNLLCRL